MYAQALSTASHDISPPGFQAQSQLVLTDGGGGGGGGRSINFVFLAHISKTTLYFFIIVSDPF